MSKEPPSRRLTFDPTPAGLVGNRSLRIAFKNEWARIRKRHFAQNDLTCELCGAVEKEQRHIVGHEVYLFPDSECVRLERIQFLCTLCHDAIHLERTRLWCGGVYVEKVEAHYCKINGVSRAVLKRDFAEAQRRGFELRESYGGAAATPKLDFGDYQQAVDKCIARKRKRGHYHRQTTMIATLRCTPITRFRGT